VHYVSNLKQVYTMMHGQFHSFGRGTGYATALCSPFFTGGYTGLTL